MRAALASALTPDVLELIVVDDGSADTTLAELRAMADSDPRVRVIALPPSGRGPALDTAFRAARGEFVMNIDADDLLHPQWSRTGTACLQAHPALAAVAASPCYIGDAENVAWAGGTSTARVHDVTRQLAHYNPITHSSAIMRRSAVEAAGGYDATRRTHLDYELWIRLASHGWRVGSLDARMVAKRLHRGQKFERGDRLSYLRESARLQVRGIRVVRAGFTAWVALAGRLAWGLLPRRVRMGARRMLARCQ